MIDLHCHIIPAIDDGSRNLEESKEMAKEAENSGFTHIFCTSHFMEEEYILKNKNQALLNKLREDLLRESIDVNLYNGNEVYISKGIISWIKKNKFQTLNNSKYILMELPMAKKPSYTDEIVFQILLQGYTPIIAHPERYEFVQEDPNILIEFIKSGVLFQMNYGSIIGAYGKRVEKTATILLKSNMIHFFGTDTHRKNSIYTKMDKIILKIKKIIGEETFEKLSTLNPKTVAENKDLKITEPLVHKKHFLFCQ